MSFLFKQNALEIWCERKIFGFEFCNVLSSFFFLGPCYLNYNKNVKKFNLPSLAIFLVGITSFLFHYTGNYFFQLTDELSMVFFIQQMILTYQNLLPKTINSFSLKIYNYSNIFFISLYLFFKIYLIFLLIFTYNLLLLFYVHYQASKKNDYSRRIFKESVFLFCFGKFLWDIERQFCEDTFFVFPLHSFWHLLSAVSAEKLMFSAKILHFKSPSNFCKINSE